MTRGEWLGFHGVEIRARRLTAAARAWSRRTGLKTRFRRHDRIVLGPGPELFVDIRRARSGQAEGVVKLHLAVRHIEAWRRKISPDDLGGDGFDVRIDALVVAVREFRRSPARRWRRGRRPRSAA